MKINLVYQDYLYLEPMLKVAEELKKRGHEIFHNADGCDISIGSHLTPLSVWSERTPLVFLDHGICPRVKSVNDISRLVKMKALMLFSGPYYERLIERAAPGYKDYRLIGNPKLEYYLERQMSREEVIKRYSLDPAKKIILYAPTWYHNKGHRRYSHGTIRYIRKIEKACRKHNLILFPHPKDLKKRYIKYASQIETKDTAMRFFEASDMLISDYSSIVVDYSYFNKPLIQLTDVFERNMRRNRENNDDVKFDAGNSVRVKELAGRVESLFKDPERGAYIRKELFDDVSGSVRGAAARAASAIEEYINDK